MSGSGAEIAALGLGIGLMFSLVCYLLTNLSPGGMITPGWLALAMVATPERVIIIAIVTVVTAGLTLVLRKYVILYGKRLFASVVMVGIFVQMTLVVLLANVMPGLTSGETIGFIIPGLMAYQLVRQPTGATLLAIGAVSSMAYGVIITGVLLGLVEESRTGFTSGITDGPLGLGAWGLVLVLVAIFVLTGGLVLNLGRIRERAAAPPPISPRRGEDPVLVAAAAAAAASAGHAGPVPPVVAHAPREFPAEPRPTADEPPALFGQAPQAAAPEVADASDPAGDPEVAPAPQVDPEEAARPKAPASAWVDDPEALTGMAEAHAKARQAAEASDDEASDAEASDAEASDIEGADADLSDVIDGHRVVAQDGGLVVSAPDPDHGASPLPEPHAFVVRARLSAYAAVFLPDAEAERLAQEVGVLPGTQAEKFAIVIQHVQQRRKPTALRNAAALVRHGQLSIAEASAMTGAPVDDIQRHLLGGL